MPRKSRALPASPFRRFNSSPEVIAITFVLLSIWSDQHRGADYASTKRVFLVAASISGIGLTAREFLQETSKRLIFDAHDLGATLVGLVAARMLFYVLTRGLRLEP